MKDIPLLCKFGVHRPFTCTWPPYALSPIHDCDRCRYWWVSHLAFTDHKRG